jgi:phage baseplate assembly protein V
MIRQVFHRLQLLCAQGVVAMVGADKIQALVLDGETLNNIDRVEPYGLSYRPKSGSRAYLFFPAGDRAYGIALVIGDKRYQMDLAEGEVALHDDEGNHVHLKRGGVIEVKASSKVIATTPLFETTQDCKIGGDLLVVGKSTLSEDVSCGANVVAVGTATAAAVLAGGFSGMAGAAASMTGGMDVTGTLTANGVSIDQNHKHSCPDGGGESSGVV